jgi:hypothetical protein
VVFQGVPSEGEEEGFAPAPVEGRRPIEAKWDEQPDVLDADRLGVEVEKRLGFVLGESIPKGLGVAGGVGGGSIVVAGAGVVGGGGTISGGAVEGSTEPGVRRVPRRPAP